MFVAGQLEQIFDQLTFGSNGGKITGQDVVEVEYAEAIQARDPVIIKSTFTKLANPDVLPSDWVLACAWDPSETYLAAGYATSGHRLNIYKRSGDTLTKLANVPTFSANVRGLSWHPSGRYLAVGTTSSPYLVLLERDGNNFAQLDSSLIDVKPNAICNDCKWDPSGTYLAVAVQSSSCALFYKFDSGQKTLAKLAFTLEEGDGYGCSWHPSGQYLGVGHSLPPRFTVLKLVDDTFIPLSSPSTIPLGDGEEIAFHPYAPYLVVAANHARSAGDPAIEVFVYKLENDVLTCVNVLAHVDCDSCAVDPSGNVLSFGTLNGIALYKFGGGGLAKLDDPDIVAPGNVRRSAWSPSGRYLAVGHSTSPYLTVYKRTDKAYKATNHLWEVADAAVAAGYAKESGSAGETHNVVRLWR